MAPAAHDRPVRGHVDHGPLVVGSHGVEFIGGDAGVSELDQLNQGRHAARVQLFQAGGMTQLGRPVQREDQLRVHGLLGPQRAVVVENRDPLLLRNEVR